MTRLFFKESRLFASRVEQLFNFVHPASVALWNLRWQVQGFVDAVPEADDAALSDRFASGSGLKANNMKGIFVSTPWEDQLGQFSQIITTNLIALYEGWAAEIGNRFGVKSLAAELQLPSKGKFGNSGKGIREALGRARAAGTSGGLQTSLFPAYSATRKYSLGQLDALLAVYRYHKQVRNSMMHRGGIANDKAEEAWRHAFPLTRANIGGRSAPLLSRITIGDPVKLSLPESIQLGDIIYRIVCTGDAELSYTQKAEDHFVDCWNATPNMRKHANLPIDPGRRDNRIAQLCRKAGFLNPVTAAPMIALCKRRGLVV